MYKQERNANRAVATLSENIFEHLQPTKVAGEERLLRGSTRLSSETSSPAAPCYQAASLLQLWLLPTLVVLSLFVM
ncbi:hypothetical protein ASZ78_000879 [Callipepla squamata]|uniref:Uncharacterized protein n=1 Tax=Callipepla squamata TaxID=9009 RepID=A0A226N6T2_CALSU|nr:hypothetical protein ASZ78_000879 [Callipepla squamata]